MIPPGEHGSAGRVILEVQPDMGRNLYILAGTLCFFSLLALVVSFTNFAQQPGSPGDSALWRTMSIAFFVLSLVIALGATLTSLFEQAERRAEDDRAARRRRS